MENSAEMTESSFRGTKVPPTNVADDGKDNSRIVPAKIGKERNRQA